MRAAVDELTEVPSSPQKLRKSDFDLTNGVANQRSLIASYEAELPLAFREDAVRMVFVVVEQFTSDGSGTPQTHNLANDLIEQPNTTDLVLFSDGARTQPDSVDAAADSFDYTDGGVAEELDVFYVARNPVQIEIEKTAPASNAGQVAETVFDDVTSILHERDQNQEPPELDFPDPSEADGADGRAAAALKPVVPRKWTIDVYADGPLAFAWDDSDTGNDSGATAINAILSIPIRRARHDVEGLGQAVKQSIIGR